MQERARVNKLLQCCPKLKGCYPLVFRKLLPSKQTIGVWDQVSLLFIPGCLVEFIRQEAESRAVVVGRVATGHRGCIKQGRVAYVWWKREEKVQGGQELRAMDMGNGHCRDSFLNGCKSSKIALIYSKEKDAEVIETQSYSPENQMKNTHWLQKKMRSNP